MNNQQEANKIWRQWQDGLNYFKSSGLTEEWENCKKFYEGDQWPKATPRTKNLPRPVVNICSMIADNKKAGILSEKLKLNFTPSEMFGDRLLAAQRGANIFTKFTENLFHDIHQQELDDVAIGYNTQLGTSFYHYFWDSDIVGGMTTPYVGSLACDVLEPENVVVANPREYDLQKQRYIIISSVENLDSVKKLAKLNKVIDADNISADNEIVDENRKDEEVCTVLTKYSRINGKVVWTKSTKNVMLQGPIYWEPGMNNKDIKLSDENGKDIEESIETPEPDIASPENNISDSFKNQLYPLVYNYHKKRYKCCYGIGEVAQAIPNNKSVNFNLAMMLLSTQQTAWPKMLQKPGALQRQQVTNTPGEILTDNSKGTNGWGVTYMQTPTFNGQTMSLTQTLIDLTRTFTGSTEVTTGEAIGSNMAASAIIALQNQAKKPIEMFQKAFIRTYIQIGKVLEQFFKYYYTDDRIFSYEEEGSHMTAQMNGEEYKDIEFKLNVDAGPAGTYSESLEVSLLDTLKANGDIDTDTYIDLYPDDIMPFKTELKKARIKMQQEQLAQQQAALLGMAGAYPTANEGDIVPSPMTGVAAIQPDQSELLEMQRKVSPQAVARATE